MPTTIINAYSATLASPTPKETRAQVLALADACRAPAMSPAWSFPFTWAAKTMDTIPKGRQQKIVTRMACTR